MLISPEPGCQSHGIVVSKLQTTKQLSSVNYKQTNTVAALSVDLYLINIFHTYHFLIAEIKRK